MLQWAVEIHDGPVAIRYPRGGDGSYHDSAWNNQCSAVCIHRNGGKVALITYGSLIQNAMDAADILYERGVNSTVVRLLNISALDSDELLCAVNGCENVFILEECLDHCGIHSELAAAFRMKDPSVNVHVMNLGSQYIAHGRLSDLYCACGLDAKSIADHILEVHQCEK
jgi:1-deoxy-D-xylulose-5-phosphate synthase